MLNRIIYSYYILITIFMPCITIPLPHSRINASADQYTPASATPLTLSPNMSLYFHSRFVLLSAGLHSDLSKMLRATPGNG